MTRFYEQRGVKITRIDGDCEFEPMKDEVYDETRVRVNCANPGDHVGDAENNNKVIKERVRVKFQLSPYSAIPKLMIKYLGTTATMACLNWFPVKGGLSPYYSPHTLMNGGPIVFGKQCKVPWSAYVQGIVSPTDNTMAGRTIDGIYLAPADNIQEGHWVMHLATGKKKKCTQLKEIPITESVIKAIEALAYKEGFKSLKVSDRHGQVL